MKVPAILALLLTLFGCSRSGEFDRYVDVASKELDVRQSRLATDWDISAHGHLDWNQETGTIVFSSGGKPAVLADITFVGSISRTSETWLWAWDNPSISGALTKDVLRVKKFGERQRFEKLVNPKWRADENDGWCMTAVAAKLLNADAAYRTDSDTGFTYLLLNNLRKASPNVLLDHSGDRPGT